MGKVLRELVVYSVSREDLPFLRSTQGRRVFKGRVLRGSLPRKWRKRKLICIGDRSACEVERSLIWSLFYDGKTLRKPIGKRARNLIRKMEFRRELRVSNPKGKITKSLLAAAKNATRVPLKVRVLGEEDLAALASIAVSPPGTLVAYGIPGKGTAIVEAKGKTRKTARLLLFGGNRRGGD